MPGFFIGVIINMATRALRNTPPPEGATDDDNWQMQVANDAGLLPGGDDDAPPPETPADRIAVMLQSVAGDDKAKVKLFRITAPGKQEWCDDYDPSQFESGGFDLIRTEWGPGVYHVMLYGRGPTGRVVVRAHDYLTIAKRAGDVAAAPQGASSDLVRMIEANNKQSQDQMRALVEAITANRPPPVDPMAQMMQMMTIAKTMREAFGAPPAPPASPISEILAGIKQIQGVAEELNPGAKDKNDDPMSMLPDLVSLIKEGMQARNNGASMPVQPLALPPSIAAAPSEHMQPMPDQPQPETTAEGDNVTPIETIMLRAILRSVLKLAQENAPYEQVAALLDKLPDDLLEMLALPMWFETLAEVAPDVLPHKEYLTRVRDQYLIDTAPDDDGESADATPSSSAPG